MEDAYLATTIDSDQGFSVRQPLVSGESAQNMDTLQVNFIGIQLTLIGILWGVLFGSVSPNEFIALGLGVIGTTTVFAPTVTPDSDP